MRWVGLTGKMAAGKDFTFAKLGEMDRRLRRVSFADELKYEVEAFLTNDKNGNEGSLPVLWEKPMPDEIRRLLQWWGTDLRRAEDPDYWVRLAEYNAHRVVEAKLAPVFTDVRFPNEADMIKANGGIIVRVLAPIETREKRLGMVPPSHLSETAMDDYEVDMHITSTQENPTYDGVLQRILVESHYESVTNQIAEALNG